MDLPKFTSLSNVIPPMIPDTPPPLDLDDDENEDVGFSGFGLASKLAYDLTDLSVEASDWSPSAYRSPEEVCSSIPSEIKDISNAIPSILNERTEVVIGEIRMEDVVSEQCNLVNDDEDDPPDVTEELHRISMSPALSSSDVDLNVRTSPEGADDNSNCVRESDYQIPSISSEFDEKDDIVSDNHGEVKVECTANDDDDFTDFADFSSQPFSEECEVNSAQSFSQDKEDKSQSLSQDEVKSFNVTQVQGEIETHDDDDFDDFESAAPPPLPTPVAEKKVEDVGSVLTSIFGRLCSEVDEPSADTLLTECLHSCLDDSSSVWGHLKDLETSFALSLQWNGSSASKRLLSSLSVDSRNILIGQRWNPSMPRFAANIGCAPLEPMKAASDDESPASHDSIPPVLLPPAEGVVPAAQFDWNSSGLINPLDCLEKEEASFAGNTSELILEKRIEAPIPVENPMSDLWSKPVSDILLPTPTDLTPTTQEDIVIPAIEPKTAESDDWTSPQSAISSHLESTDIDIDSVDADLGKVEEQTRMSAEACRVVETLPDLSFLSARKLLYAANANMARFQASARP